MLQKLPTMLTAEIHHSACSHWWAVVKVVHHSNGLC